MEKVEGVNLEQWVEDNSSISEELAINWLQQIAEILALVHQKGFYHRDIKPSNIMLKPDGKLVLIDFGAVREISPTLLGKIESRNVTQVVSKGYTAPEQIQGQAIPKSDLFSLGRTFVYLLTGISPTELEDSETKHLIAWRECCTGISEPLADLIDRLIATSSQNRPRNPQDILKWITQIQLDDGTKIKENLLEVTAIVNERIRENILFRLGRASKFKFGLAALSFLGFISFRLAAPQLAISFNDRAYDNYVADKLDKAQVNISLALMLNPNLGEAHYIQGRLFDARQDFYTARLEYEKAMESVPDKVYSSLGRLEIIGGHYADAIARLEKGLQLVKEVDSKSALHKNMGWALLKLGNNEQAYTQLQKAIALNSDRPSAYCLLAQVLEAQGNKVGALGAWKSCLHKYAPIDKPLPEVKDWTAQAEQRLAPQAAQVFDQK
ncbi:serine/threonine-protein kinase [Argonema antarcticum]|nr:serine/threonine-protein kinase [Argonema antarcticum]